MFARNLKKARTAEPELDEKSLASLAIAVRLPSRLSTCQLGGTLDITSARQGTVIVTQLPAPRISSKAVLESASSKTCHLEQSQSKFAVMVRPRQGYSEILRSPTTVT
jgi:hypothetical protein